MAKQDFEKYQNLHLVTNIYMNAKTQTVLLNARKETETDVLRMNARNFQ